MGHESVMDGVDAGFGSRWRTGPERSGLATVQGGRRRPSRHSRLHATDRTEQTFPGRVIAKKVIAKKDGCPDQVRA